MRISKYDRNILIQIKYEFNPRIPNDQDNYFGTKGVLFNHYKFVFFYFLKLDTTF